MFTEFQSNELKLERLNYGLITLLPKVKEANRIQQYRPICLLNVVYKIFTKSLMLRLETVMARSLIDARQGLSKVGTYWRVL